MSFKPGDIVTHTGHSRPRTVITFEEYKRRSIRHDPRFSSRAKYVCKGNSVAYGSTENYTLVREILFSEGINNE